MNVFREMLPPSTTHSVGAKPALLSVLRHLSPPNMHCIRSLCLIVRALVQLCSDIYLSKINRIASFQLLL